MQRRQCEACGQLFEPRAQVPDQRYCGEAACQRERRRHWQQTKRRGDADYRDNQRRAQQTWLERHRDYWREYRRTHPQYEERNRTQQRRRDRTRPEGDLAKMYASTTVSPVPSGTYRLTPVRPNNLAKMYACTVEISLLSEG